jgi:hypothetical protein
MFIQIALKVRVTSRKAHPRTISNNFSLLEQRLAKGLTSHLGSDEPPLIRHSRHTAACTKETRANRNSCLAEPDSFEDEDDDEYENEPPNAPNGERQLFRTWYNRCYHF